MLMSVNGIELSYPRFKEYFLPVKKVDGQWVEWNYDKAGGLRNPNEVFQKYSDASDWYESTKAKFKQLVHCQVIERDGETITSIYVIAKRQRVGADWVDHVDRDENVFFEDITEAAKKIPDNVEKRIFAFRLPL